MINPTRLQQITDGDISLQRELLGLFFDTVTRCMGTMRDVSDAADTAWRDAAHEMKGAANTLGFERIGAVCLRVQVIPSFSSADKQAALRELEAAIMEVTAFAEAIAGT